MAVHRDPPHQWLQRLYPLRWLDKALSRLAHLFLYDWSTFEERDTYPIEGERERERPQ
jgi:sugar phosphate isomerase/epimerase